MLTGINVYNFRNTTLPALVLNVGSDTDLVQLKEVEGLGPVKANISSSPYGLISGEAILGTNIGMRNIVLKLGLNPDWETQTIEELRKVLYECFMPPNPVTLKFFSTHLPDCQIEGIIEDMIPNIFSKDPEISVSIICGRPDFIAVDETVETGNVFTATTFSEINSSLGMINYSGNIPTGFVLDVEAPPGHALYTGAIHVYFQEGTGSLKLNGHTLPISAVEINADDLEKKFEMSSVPGEKYVRTKGVGVDESLLNYVEPSYAWPLLHPPVNKFGVRGYDGSVGLTWTMSYFARFGGL